jgi:amino acid permease
MDSPPTKPSPLKPGSDFLLGSPSVGSEYYRYKHHSAPPELNPATQERSHLSASMSKSHEFLSEPLIHPRSRDATLRGRGDSLAAGFSLRGRYSLLALASRGSVASGPAQAVPDPSTGLSPVSVGINVVKCAVGAGSFSIPAAFLSGGFTVGIVSTIMLGVVGAFTAVLLLRAELYVRLRRMRAGFRDNEELTYPALAFHAFGGRAGWCMQSLCVFGVVVTSLGVCAAYVDFIGEALHQLDALRSYDPKILTVATFPIVLGLALLRTFKYLTFTSILGDVAVVSGIVVTIGVGWSKCGIHSPAALPKAPSDWSEVPKSIATIAFLFLIHVVLLPIASSLRTPPMDSADLDHSKTELAEMVGDAKVRSFTQVAVVSFVFITLLNVSFGAICALLFGANTKSNVLQNLNDPAWAGDAVRMLLCVDLLFTVPMVLAAGRQLVEGQLVQGEFALKHETLVRNSCRLVLVIAVYSIALAVPDFGDMVSLVGGFANCLMGLILPPLCFISAAPDGKIASLARAVLLFIALFGSALLISSTFFTLQGIVSPAAAVNATTSSMCPVLRP